MEKQDWQYLAERLETIGQGLCLEAAHIVRAVLAVDDETMEDPKLEYAGCYEIGGFVSRALDREDFDPSHLPSARALEAEMLGRVYFYRLSKGWLIRSPDAPIEVPSVSELIGK